jgi:hypothetical protein
VFSRLAHDTLARAGYLVTLARLRMLDRAIREQGELLLSAFPETNFDDPMPRRNRLP